MENVVFKKRKNGELILNELYLTGAVIANGVPDSDNDTLDSVEIRTIFTKYTKHLSDIQHDAIDYDGVDVLANWISESEATIKGNTIPEKSWMATVKVTDPETITAINKGELTCFSLGSVSSTAKTREAWFINKRLTYHALKSIEDVIPLRISIVDSGANGLPFEVVDYATYINKNYDGDVMSENEDKFSLDTIKGLFSLKKEIEDEVTINKAENNEPATTNDAEKSIDALFEKVDYLVEKVDAIEAALNTNVEKAEENDEEQKKEEEEEEKDEEKIEKEESESTEEDDNNGEKIEKKSETVIEKSTVKPHDIPTAPQKTSNFFERTGRDALGRKIRKQ